MSFLDHRAAAGRTLLLAALACACESKTEAPRLVPLAAPSRGATDPSVEPKVELARPVQPVAEATPVPPPAIPPIEAGDLDSMIQALGPLGVISVEDARQEAERTITSVNADQELQKLKDELGGGG